MKKIIKLGIGCLFVVILSGTMLFAQNNYGKTNDAERIALGAYVPSNQILEIPVSARRSLQNKLSQIPSHYGMGGTSGASRFIITAQVVILDKEVIPSPPVRFLYNMELSLYIGDLQTGQLFATEIFELKGIGNNEAKAYINAFRGLASRDPRLEGFINKGKEKIIRFYNDNCDFILDDARALLAQQEYDRAIAVLNGVPKVCKECYAKAKEIIAPIYQEKIDNECQMMLAEARNIWSSGQKLPEAKNAMRKLARINPKSKCFSEAYQLSETIAQRVKQLNDREYKLFLQDRERNWQLQVTENTRNFELRKAEIEANKVIGSSYAKNEYKGFERVISRWFGL